MFEEWMINKKGYSWKSTHEVIFRQKCVRNILNIQKFNNWTIDTLEKMPHLKNYQCRSNLNCVIPSVLLLKERV